MIINNAFRIQGNDENEWQRPVDYPEYTERMLENFEGVYFTVSLKISTPKISLSFISDNGYYVKRGIVKNGKFIQQGETIEKPGSTNQINFKEIIDLDVYTNDYLVYQVTPKENSKITKFMIDGSKFSNNINGSSATGDGTFKTSTIVEIFGNLPNFTGTLTGYEWNGLFCKSITLANLKPSNLDCPFRSFRSIENIRLINFKPTSIKATGLNSFFANCTSLEFLNIDEWEWDTSNVNTLQNMFGGCNKIKKLDLTCMDTSNVTNMSSVFQNCWNLKTLIIENWNTSKVTTMNSMFGSCYNLESIDLSNWNVSSLTTMSSMFNGCINIKSINLNNWDTSNVTNISQVFYDCRKVETINLNNWNTSKVTTMVNFLNWCRNVKKIDLSSFNLSLVTTIQNLFSGMFCLEELSLSDGKTYNFNNKTWEASPSVPSSSTITNFLDSGSGALTTINSFPAIPKSFSLSFSTALTVESLLVVINALPNVSTSQTLTLGTVNKSKLTIEQIAIAEAKGWTVA